ncbi:pentatricopeptide repeat-containing protein At3g12770 isoform X1 [Cryptomeria japonica]|uniref:pentatricopeptide repeat-containing protein At3g12770 isoform X1 n=2 Tax=Cryptomeria japonica TaxID=3369 RepID=UPI0027D9E1F0|nr:pentatricopeptide repeat-containing protein At3g12770 isoform X1 [Cryptomeria japonica]
MSSMKFNIRQSIYSYYSAHLHLETVFLPSCKLHFIHRYFCAPPLPQHQLPKQQHPATKTRVTLSHTSQIRTLCRNGRLKEALKILQEMENIPADPATYASLLQACGDMKALEEGKKVHTHIISNVIEQSVFLETNLVTMYGKCDSLSGARDVFDLIKEPNVFSLNAMIRGYAAQENNEAVVKIYEKMRSRGVEADGFTFIIVLKACAKLGDLELGKKVHEDAATLGLEGDVFVGNAISAMYTKCGSFENARQVFDKMPERDVVSWNGMIASYGRQNRFGDALILVRQMVAEGLRPNSTTMVSVLPLLAQVGALRGGKEAHGFVIRNEFEGDGLVRNGLVSMYAKCGSLENACIVFDKMPQRDVASWNAMIAGYAQNGRFDEALGIFKEMVQVGVNANMLTIASILPACSCLSALYWGREIHAYAVRRSIEFNVIVASALMDMYANCRRVEDAIQVFRKMPQKDVVAWNVMIAGYVQNQYFSNVLKLFYEMLQEDIRPDSFTIVSVLSACAHLVALRHGKEIHDYTIRHEFESNTIVGSAIVDMYAKCGSVEDAWKWFMKLPQKDLISWNAMIIGYGMHGHGKQALTLFHQMQNDGMEPDEVTFTAILSACSHAGLVDEGRQYFNQISHKYCMTPTIEHYSCMADLLARAGHLDEAHNFIKNMPLEPNRTIWGTLLGACRNYRNVELGEQVAERLFEIEPENEGNYVLLSNIYAAAGRWDGVQRVRKMMKEKGIRKNPGCSWIEFQNKVHVFLSGDKRHPQTEKIYAALDNLTEQMKRLGYVPDTSFVLYDVEELEKERAICSHSERLAIVFGLINTCNGTPIRVTKNLRVCGDCHIATKFMSKIAKREIIVRDTNRFHHFKDGLCSCGDYW